MLNGAAYLGRALQSLLSQTHSDIRIILSDNGSDDESLHIAQGIARLDSRVKVYPGKKGTAADNFNFVLKQSTASAFMWSAHDDYWHPEFVSKGVKALSGGARFYLANWWMGDINSNRGFTQSNNPLGFLESSDSLVRVVKFLNLHHNSNKCNLVYGLFESKLLKHAANQQSIENDGALSALISAYASGVIDNEVLYWKQSQSMSNGRIPTPSLATRIVSNIRSLFLPREKRFSYLKEKSLAELKEHFPELKKTLQLIYSHYREYSESDEIFPDENLLLRTAKSENARDFSWTRT